MMSMLSLAPHISKFIIISASAVISFLPMLIPFCCGAREYRLCFVGLIAVCAILLVYVLIERKRISYRFDIIDLSIAVYLAAGLLNMYARLRFTKMNLCVGNIQRLATIRPNCF